MIVLCALFAVVSGVFGDTRYYAWTYHFATVMPGETEVEVYTRLTQPDIGNGATAKWVRQIEIETGLTGRWDISAYLVDGVDTAGSVSFEEIKLRTRFKITENTGDFFVDPLIYAEYIFKADRSSFDAVEAKIILAKDFGAVNAAFNIIAEVSNENWLAASNWETGYSAGVSYALLDGGLRLGVEAKGNWQSGKHMAGPSVSVETGRLFLVVSPLFGLGSRPDDVSVQAILGVML